jgi:5-methylcytosine-specific restriction endonuclease McrA
MEEIRPSHYGNGKFSYREKAFRELEHKCAECGYTNVDALEVHHIDKNRDNNDISNLVILCANCHTIRHKGL